MNESTLLTILTLLGGGTGISGILVALATRKKSKGEATVAIEQAAAHLVEQYRRDNIDLRAECVELRSKLDNLEGRVDEQDACQTTLKQQINTLEQEKRDLMEQIAALRKRVDELEQENARLRDKKV